MYMLLGIERKYTEMLLEATYKRDPREPVFDFVLNSTFRYLKSKGYDTLKINNKQDLVTISEKLRLHPGRVDIFSANIYIPLTQVYPYLMGLFITSVAEEINSLTWLETQERHLTTIGSDCRSLCDYDFLCNRTIARIKPIWDEVENGSKEAGINLDF